jgi:hypothetical protein
VLARRPLRLLLLVIAVSAAAMPAHALQSKAVWGGVAYLPGSEGYASAVIRYDLAARAWLPPLVDPLLAGSGGTALAVDASGVYVEQGFIGRLIRFPHGGGAATVVLDGGISHFALYEGRVLVLANGVFRVLDASTGTEIDSVVLPPQTYTFAVAAAERRAVFPSDYDLVGVDLADDGTVGPVVATPRFGPRNFIPDLVPLPDGRRVLEARSGHVFDARTLRYVEALPADVADAAFASGTMIVKTRYRPGNHLMSFDAGSLTEIGRKFVGTSSSETIVEHAGDVFLFWSDYEGIRIDVVPLADLALPPRPADYDPSPFDFDVRNLVVTRDEIAIVQPDAVYGPHDSYMPSEVLFRWSVADRAYRPNLALREAPSRLLYDADADALYVFYPTGRIGRIAAPGGAGPEEEDFAVAPWPPGPVAKLGDRFLIADGDSSDGLFVLGEDARARSFFTPSEHVERLAAVDAIQRVYLFGRGFEKMLQRFGLNGVSKPSDVTTRLVPDDMLEVVPSPDGALLFDGKSVRDGATLSPVADPLVPSRAPAVWLGGRLAWGRDGRIETAAPPFSAVQGSYEIGEDLWVGSLTPLSDGALLAYVTDGRSYRRNWTRFARVFPGPDLDGDGVENDADRFRLDAAESADRDDDGVGDNADPFPDNPRYWLDGDGDGIADELDEYPARKELSASRMSYVVGATVPPYGRLRGSIQVMTHLFDDGELAICPADDSCLPGTFVPGRGGRLEIELLPEVVDALEAGLEAELEETFSELRERPVDLALSFRRDKLRLTARVAKNGARLRVDLRFPWVASTQGLRVKRLHGVFRMHADGETLASEGR